MKQQVRDVIENTKIVLQRFNYVTSVFMSLDFPDDIELKDYTHKVKDLPIPKLEWEQHKKTYIDYLGTLDNERWTRHRTSAVQFKNRMKKLKDKK